MGISRNIFNKLLNKDFEKTFQPEGSYRDAQNVRIIQRSDGSYSAESFLGMRITFTLPYDDWKILGSVSNEVDRLYIWCGGNELHSSSGKYISEIGYVTFDMEGIPTGTYTTLYHIDPGSNNYDVPLNIHSDYPVCDIARIYVEETENIKTLYFSDYNNVPRRLNTASPAFQKVDGNGGIQGGVYYQVRSSTATYNGTVYGPGQAAGNIFLGVAGITSVSAGGSDIVEHLFVESLAWNPEKDAGYIYCNGFEVGGILPAGSYLALYTLITKDGYKSPYGYTTMPISLSEGTISSADIQGYQGYQGEPSTRSSSKSIKLRVEDIDTSYEKIEIVMIRFTDRETYELPRIHYRADITASTMDVTVDGRTSLGELTVEELKKVINVFKKIGTMASNKNRLFVADVELKEGVENWSPGSVGYEWFDYETPSDMHGDKYAQGSPLFSWLGHYAAENDVTTGNIHVGSWYEVSSAGATASDYVTYNGTNYGPHASFGSTYFQGVASGSSPFYAIKAITVNGDAEVHAVIRIKEYKSQSGTDVYKYYRIGEDFYDMKGIVASSLLKSYKRGEELYRYGVMGLSKEGVPLFVKHLFDASTPDYDTMPLTAQYIENVTATYKNVTNTKHMGIRIGTDSNPLDISDIADKVSAICIVRAKRIRKSVGQGILKHMVLDEDDGNKMNVMAGGYAFSDQFFLLNPGVLGVATNAMAFYSPEYLGFYESTENKYADVQMRISDYLYDSITDYGDVKYPGASAGATINWGMHEMIAPTISPFHPACYLKYHKQDVTYSTAYPKGHIATVDSITQTFGHEDNLVIPNNPRTYRARTRWTGYDGTTNYYSEGFSGRNVILQMSQDPYFNIPFRGPNTKMLVDILDPDNLNPNYGDTSITQYQLCGHILPVNDALYAANGNSWKLKEIEVFGGDIYVNLFNVNTSRAINGLAPSSTDADHQDGVGIIESFPVESEINIALRRGRHGHKDGCYLPGIFPNGVKDTQPEDFLFDGAYINDAALEYRFAGEPKDLVVTNVRRNNIYISDPKVLGETIDNFRVFPALNERFAEISNGFITALMRDKGMLFCFQNTGVLYLPVDEATTVTSDIGESVLIGVGGIIDRYDERTERYGLQDRHHLLKLSDGFLWVDINKEKVCYMTNRGGVVNLSTVLGMANYFHQFLRGSDIQDNPSGLNPYNHIGISSGYDEIFNEAYLTFKTETSGKENFTIGFNEIGKAFTSFYGWHPSYYARFKNLLMSGPSDHYTVYTTTIPAGVSFTKGQKIIFDDGTTTTIFRINQSFVSTATSTPETEDEYSRTSDTDEVWLINSRSGMSICKIYGEIQEESITVIINSSNGAYKRFDTLQIQGNAGERDTDGILAAAIHSTITQTTEEHSATGLTDEFKFRRGSYRGNFLRDQNNEDNRRMRGFYLELKLSHDHNTGKSTVTTGEHRYQDASDDLTLKIVSLFTTWMQSKSIVKQ